MFLGHIFLVSKIGLMDTVRDALVGYMGMVIILPSFMAFLCFFIVYFILRFIVMAGESKEPFSSFTIESYSLSKCPTLYGVDGDRFGSLVDWRFYGEERIVSFKSLKCQIKYFMRYPKFIRNAIEREEMGGEKYAHWAFPCYNGDKNEGKPLIRLVCPNCGKEHDIYD